MTDSTIGQKLHVVTYVKHKGDDTEDVLAQETLAPPVGDADGGFVDAMVSYTKNFQCDGHESSGGCTKVHGHAVERVRSRVVDEEGGVKVIWRRFHPLIADGVAKPGEPFEAKDDEVSVRVEVRRVVESEDEEIHTPSSISMLSLRGLQKDLNAQKALGDLRVQVRSELAVFQDTHLLAAQQHIDAVVDRLKDLPDHAEVEAAQKKCEASLAAIAKGLAKKSSAAVKNPLIDANVVNEFKQALVETEPSVGQIFAPLKAVEDKAAALLVFQDAVRAQAGRMNDMQARIDESSADLPTLDVSKIDRAGSTKGLDTLLGKTKKDGALANMDALQAELTELTEGVDGLEAQLGEAVAAEQLVADAFAAKVARVEVWRTDPEQGRQEISDFIQAGGALAGFAVPYWTEQADKALAKAAADLPELDALSYHSAKDQKTLDAALKKLGPIQEFVAEVEADMVARNDGIYAVVKAGEHQFEAPSASFTVTATAGETFSAQVNLRNNSDRPMRLEIHSGGACVQTAILGGKGRRATFDAANLSNPVSVVVTGIAQPGAVAAGQNVVMDNVNVPGNPIDVVGQGSTRHLLPYTYTPSPDQPVGQANAVVEPADGKIYSTQRIPGV